MKIVHSLNLNSDTAEERLPDYTSDFPCLTTRAELQYYPDALVPWHWHPAAELFFMPEGSLDYHLPGSTVHIGQGDGGLLLPNILHRTSWDPDGPVVMLIHLFDPSLLFGKPDTRMFRKYLAPLLSDSGVSFIPLRMDCPRQAELLSVLRDSFSLDENLWEYEYRLQNELCRLWLEMCRMPHDDAVSIGSAGDSDALKQMLSFILAHLSEPINVRNIAMAGGVSLRSCYRMFREQLHIAPNAYIQSARIQRACALLENSGYSVTETAMECGFGSSSYFGRQFRRITGKTPGEYQRMAR